MRDWLLEPAEGCLSRFPEQGNGDGRREVIEWGQAPKEGCQSPGYRVRPLGEAFGASFGGSLNGHATETSSLGSPSSSLRFFPML